MELFIFLLLGYIGVRLTEWLAILPMDMLNWLQPSWWLGLGLLLFLFSWFLGE
ncbi:hypothetical protein [Trichothermofontia sp.]